MKDINIGTTIIAKRKEKGITQDEIAHYIGVSKSSVSKWERGQSYPDITLLPQLAAYFNLSIDELMGYEPHLSKIEIRKLYLHLSIDFSKKPFDEVMTACRQITRKYFSCFPLLLQMGILMVNHVELVKTQEEGLQIIEEAKALFIRAKENSPALEVRKQALFMEAYCCLALGKPEEARALLEETVVPLMSTETLLATAYEMTGELEKSKEILQVTLYQHMLTVVGVMTQILKVYADDEEKYETSMNRIFKMIETFQLETLHPFCLFGTYLQGAQGYMAQNKKEKALELLKKYTDLATRHEQPMKLHGDGFFNLIENWFEELDLGGAMPRDEKVVKQSMIDGLEKNPVFVDLQKNPQFITLVQRLKNNL